jgi:type II secretory pathway pseudopilin PulG
MKTLQDETGETLVELMVTILIMAIGVTAVAAALTMTIQGSDAHHGMSQGEVLVRDYGEAIKDQAMKDFQSVDYNVCPVRADLLPGDFDENLAGTGNSWQADITLVEYWVSGTGTSTTNPAQFTDDPEVCTDAYDACVLAQGPNGFTPACDPGYQRVTYHVSNNRDDYGKSDIYGRVLTRRNNEAPSA